MTGANVAMEPSQEATDKAMMARCIELSRIAVSKGEYPFGTVIARGGQVVAEAINRNVRDADITRHAEVIALFEAQKAIGRKELYRCTLYTNVEPCAMCSYCLREAGIGRVAYAIASPIMGGVSKWNILRDEGISDRIPQVFGAVPEVVSGLLAREAQQAWRDWNPLAWQMIKLRGLMTDPGADNGHIRVQPAHRRSLWHFLQELFTRPHRPQTDAKAQDREPLGIYDPTNAP
jgi:tRNA(adenine34) deaminase